MFSDTFDRAKSAKNKAERGMDFVEARAIWLDPSLRTVEANTVEGEPRFASIGFVDGKLWVAVWADMVPERRIIFLDHEPVIRIISVHRAEKTKFERMYYGKD